MGRKTYVLDTNVLLHDPKAILKFTGNNVIMPLASLEELDKLKRYTDELGKNARFVLRFIDSLSQRGNIHEGMELGDGVFFKLLMDVKSEKKFPLSLTTARNKILHICFSMKEQYENVVLVSKDIVLRVKAESIGIKAEDYENAKESYANLYRGIRKQTLSKKEIDEFLVKGNVSLDLKEKPLPNEYFLLNAKEGSSQIGKYNVHTNQIEPLPRLKRDIWGLTPLNDEQRCAMDLLLRDDIKLVSFIGQAGTGKTLLALTCGLKKVFDEGVYKKILITRPIMPLGKDIGYLPGSKEEKILHWMQPIYDNLEYLCEETSPDGDGEETKRYIIDSNKIEMEAVTYIRGRSFSKTYIIIDEAQNLSPHEVKTIISRAGKGTKVILTGDPSQIDNPYLDKDSNAMTYVVNKFKAHSIYGHIYFEKTERSELAALAAALL